MDTLANHDWIGWGIGLAAVVLAVVFYFKSKATTRLVYQWRGRQLIGGDGAGFPDDVTISYKGAAVPRLSSSEIIFWNAGNLTVRGSDIVEADPLRVVLNENTKILRVLVTSVTRPVNLFVAKVHSERHNETLCTFDYLDPGDGARIEMLHTSEEQNVNLRGTVRGLPQGVSSWGRMQSASTDRRSRSTRKSHSFQYIFPYVVTFGSLLVLCLAGLARIIQSHYPNMAFWLPGHEISREDQLTVSGVALFYMAPGALMLWARRRRFPKALSQDD